MKAMILVKLKEEVLDCQGRSVCMALSKLGFDGIKNVRIGKIIEIDIDDDYVSDDLKARLERMGAEFLANEVMEDCEVKFL